MLPKDQELTEAQRADIMRVLYGKDELTPSKPIHMEQTTPYEVKDFTGTIWLEVQTKEGTNGTYEVMSGSCKIFGKDMYINAYPKETKGGKKILSITFKEKPVKTETSKDTDQIPF